jgi:hypothetical protein
MARHLFLLIAGLLASAAQAHAQYPYPYQNNAGSPPRSPAGPVLSPYLNLNNGSGNAGVNYYNFVRPQLQLQQQQQFFGGMGSFVDPYPLATDITLDPTGRLPRSGPPPATFMNYGSYFNSMGTIGVASRGGQQAAGRAGQPAAPSVPRR